MATIRQRTEPVTNPLSLQPVQDAGIVELQQRPRQTLGVRRVFLEGEAVALVVEGGADLHQVAVVGDLVPYGRRVPDEGVSTFPCSLCIHTVTRIHTSTNTHRFT